MYSVDFIISEQEKKLLLFQARESIASKLKGCQPQYEDSQYDSNSALNKNCGAFVSLHTTDGRNLRGCIGRMTANLPLIETVRLMAREAAFGDPRFPPLTAQELNRCYIEISALSPMEICPDPMQVKVGVHGLYIRKGGASGVLLPQVPVEQGWNLNQYLEYICIKAGLPLKAWKDSGSELFTFTAVVFNEE